MSCVKQFADALSIPKYFAVFRLFYGKYYKAVPRIPRKMKSKANPYLLIFV